jgi:hypothetical protein
MWTRVIRSRRIRNVLAYPIQLLSNVFGHFLSSRLLLALEVAIEYWLALSFSIEAKKLTEEHADGSREAVIHEALRREMEQQKSSVWQFIIDRCASVPCFALVLSGACLLGMLVLAGCTPTQAPLLHMNATARYVSTVMEMVRRHLQAPDRFRAIQTYRAAMAIMAQQRQFIHRMYNSGVLSDAEKVLMEEVLPRSILHFALRQEKRSSM